MKKIIISIPLALFLSSHALAQAGAEGQYDLLVPTTLAAPAVSAAPSVAMAAAPRRLSAPTAMSAAAPKLSFAPRSASTTSQGTRGVIGDYDFGEVVQTLRNSVQPLAGEIDTNFPRFVSQIDDAIVLTEQGRNPEAVAMSVQAIDGVLGARDTVINPLWEAQFYLNEQIATVRSRLASSLTASDPATSAGKATAQSAQMLDQIASRIAATKDPMRKKKLVAHYRTMRTLSKVRSASLSMTPDQRKVWFGVLKVLEQASVAHQQVLMGSEALFAQLDGTATQLQDYLGLMQTIEGVDSLLGSVEGGGLDGFVDGMRTLQDQMELFSKSMEGTLESSMIDLETRVDSMQSTESESGGIITPTSVDEELQSRIDRVAH